MNASLASKFPGFFASKIGGQFAPVLGGQFIRFLQKSQNRLISSGSNFLRIWVSLVLCMVAVGFECLNLTFFKSKYCLYNLQNINLIIAFCASGVPEKDPLFQPKPSENVFFLLTGHVFLCLLKTPSCVFLLLSPMMNS
jgi:hypothetical protein